MASIIKTILVLETGVIPPNANFENLNPAISAEDLRLVVREIHILSRSCAKIGFSSPRR